MPDLPGEELRRSIRRFENLTRRLGRVSLACPRDIIDKYRLSRIPTVRTFARDGGWMRSVARGMGRLRRSYRRLIMKPVNSESFSTPEALRRGANPYNEDLQACPAIYLDELQHWLDRAAANQPLPHRARAPVENQFVLRGCQ